jgi:hypothetical protein
MENQLLKNLKVISPSYKRADLCTSHKLFPKDIFYYAVEESEYDLYKSKGFNCIPLPKRNPQNIASARNCILNQRNSKYITMIDDDCRGFFWRLRRKRVQLSMDDILKFMSIGYQMAEDSDSGLWGINLNSDPLAYQVNNPFYFSSPVLGTFSNIIDEDLRYDESITLKEDYDYFLQQMEKYRKVLRFNYLYYVVDHLKLSGGCQTYRTKEEEERQKILLQKKWGSDIVQYNPRKDRNTTNMIIKSPI